MSIFFVLIRTKYCLYLFIFFKFAPLYRHSKIMLALYSVFSEIGQSEK